LIPDFKSPGRSVLERVVYLDEMSRCCWVGCARRAWSCAHDWGEETKIPQALPGQTDGDVTLFVYGMLVVNQGDEHRVIKDSRRFLE
jgi:hypothetical protein